MREAFICDAIRTPIGRYAGVLASVRADDLGAIPIRALRERNPSVDFAAIDDVSFGWGMIAKIYKGSTARFTRRRVGEAWLPVETRFDGAGRALMVRRVDIDFRRDYFDYRPFDIADLPVLLGWAAAP